MPFKEHAFQKKGNSLTLDAAWMTNRSFGSARKNIPGQIQVQQSLEEVYIPKRPKSRICHQPQTLHQTDRNCLKTQGLREFNFNSEDSATPRCVCDLGLRRSPNDTPCPRQRPHLRVNAKKKTISHRLRPTQITSTAKRMLDDSAL